MNQFVKSGDLAGLWSKDYTENDEENPIAGIMKGINFGQKVVFSIPTAAKAAGKAIYNDITKKKVSRWDLF